MENTKFLKVLRESTTSAVVPEATGPMVSIFENANYIPDKLQY